MAHNLLQGRGLTVNTSPITDLSQVYFTPDTGWPPLYSLLLNLFPFALRENFMRACWLVDVLSVLLFFFFCRKLLLRIGFPDWCTNLFLLFQGCFLVSGSSPTDFMAMSFIVAALYFIIRQTQAFRFSLTDVAGISVFLLLACFTRYQYIPVAAVLAGCMMLLGAFQKKTGQWKAGLAVLVSLIACCGAYLLYQQQQTGSAAYVVPVPHGWYPAQVLEMHPFMVSGIINLHFYAVQLSLHTGIGYGSWLAVARWFSLLLLGVFLVQVICQLVQLRRQPAGAWNNFLLFGFVAFAGSVSLLVLLSIRLDKAIGAPLFNWTYVMEKRYFALAVFILQVWLWRSLFLQVAFVRKPAGRMLRFGFAVLVCFEMVHGAYFIVKELLQGVPPLAEVVTQQPEQAVITRFIAATRRDDPQRSIVVTGFYKRYAFLAGLQGASGLFGPLVLNTSTPATSRPAVLLAVIERNSLSSMHHFIQQPGVRLLANTPNSCIYTLFIEPNTSHDRP